MKQVVLITGAHGVIAKYLAKQLEGVYTVRYLTRKVTKDNEYLWDLKANYIDPEALIGVHSVIHLAGSSIANKPWSKKRKQLILSSRVDSALLLLEELKKRHLTIDSFISASAIGYYGATTSETIFKEESPQGSDFLSAVCSKWERTAQLFKTEKVAARVAIVRCGIVFSKQDGALKQIVRPIRYGLGSGIGKGTQYVPWIHIHDLCGIFKFLLENKSRSGLYNAVSPEHLTNIDLTKKIAKLLHRQLILPNIPSFIIKGLVGERAIILLEGSRVSSDKILNAGFKFTYANLEKALISLL
ncbi:MAG: TIGR01777 family oxidoreductase [Massilibacteroides sp.]|nr:TIGR01777 family oxidoreductase [Massilibacteroides sp.]